MTTLTQRMNVVEDNLQSIRLTLDTLLQNLLNPALMVPGTLRFGGNVMQLDNNGIQVRTITSPTPAVHFVSELVPDPNSSPPVSALSGFIGSDYSSIYMSSTAPTDGIATVSTSASDTTSIATIGAYDTSSVGPSIELTGKSDVHRVKIVGSVALNSAESPAQLTANQDNYNPSGLYATTVLRLTSDASRDITGIVPTDNLLAGQVLILFNVGGFNIVLKNDVTSTAANRFLFPADITLAPNEGIGLMYDATSSRWRCFGRY